MKAPHMPADQITPNYDSELAKLSKLASQFLSAEQPKSDLSELAEETLGAALAAVAASPTLARYQDTLERMGRPPASTTVLPEFTYCIQAD
jgi:hypothetical protein